MTVAELFAKLGLKVDGKSFSAGEKMIGGIKKGLAALAAYSTVKIGFGFVKEIADAADHLDELAQKTGVPVETLQELGYAAGFSGVSIEQLGGALGTLARTMDRAQRGSKEQASAFKAAGVSYKDAAGNLRPVDDVLGDLADRFAAMPDGPKKSALAVRVFRGAGRDLIPVLNEGREGLAKLREEFRKSGAMIDGPTAESFAGFNDDMDRLHHQVYGLKVQIVSALLPGLKLLVKGALEWVKANRQLIVDKITASLKVLASVLRTVYEALAPVVATMYQFVEAAVKALDKLGILKYALMAAAAAIAVSWLGAALPFVLIGAAIGAVALLVEDLYVAIKGGDSILAAAFDEGLAALRSKFGGFFDWYEKNAVALGLIEGRDVVNEDLETDYNRRTGKGLARVNSISDFNDSLRTERQANPKSLADLLSSRGANEPSVLDNKANGRAQYRNSRAAALDTGTQVALSQFGLGAAIPAVLPQRAAGGAAIPIKAGPTVTIGGITIEAGGADAKEIARRIRDEIDAQIRTLEGSSGAKATP